jgi:hypothetical protein
MPIFVPRIMVLLVVLCIVALAYVLYAAPSILIIALADIAPAIHHLRPGAAALAVMQR